MHDITPPIYRRFILAGVVLINVLLLGTFGYWYIGEGDYSLFDCFYMTAITILTIGYGETINLDLHPNGRVFTIVIAFMGIGTVTYILSNFTALIVEGDLQETFKQKKMEQRIKTLKDHYIICGIGRVGLHILNELESTHHSTLIVDTDENAIKQILILFPEEIYLRGDATDDEVLLHAGVKRARGVFAATDDDSRNLVISLTAKHLNPRIRVVARCQEPRNVEKMRKAGADSVISTAFIGGLRMASEMLRPTVVSFLDTMLRDKNKNLRVEEIAVPPGAVGQPICHLQLQNYPSSLLIALKTGAGWVHNPRRDQILAPDTTLIFMTTPDEREKLRKGLG